MNPRLLPVDLRTDLPRLLESAFHELGSRITELVKTMWHFTKSVCGMGHAFVSSRKVINHGIPRA